MSGSPALLLDSENEEDESEEKKPKIKKKKKKIQVGFERKLKGAKNLIMSPIISLDKAVSRRRNRPPPPPFPYNEDFAHGCRLCFLPPKTASESSAGENKEGKSESYHDFVKNLLERNDFYAPECNVHGDWKSEIG